MTEEIFNTVRKVWPELERLLRERHPELLPVFRMRYQYATGPYPDAMRWHNAFAVLAAYEILRDQK